MNSKITDIFNALVAFLETNLPDAQRIWDPYFMDRNPEQVLRNGWGIRVNSGVDTDRFICPEYTLSRTFGIVLARENPAVDSDPATRETDRLSILEDLHKLLVASVSDNTLGGLALDFKYDSDAGFEEVYVNEKPYTYLVSDFAVEYSQPVQGA